MGNEDLKCVWFRAEHDSSFLGIGMAQRWVDLVVWEHILNSYGELRTLIELGTGRGGFSIYLLLQALQRGMEFWTFDYKPRVDLEAPVARVLRLSVHFRQADIFDKGQQRVTELLSTKSLHPLLLFCDDGHKPREFRIFAPLLLEGDLVGVHDWGIEFGERDLEYTRDRLEPVFLEECQALGSITRFWKVIA